MIYGIGAPSFAVGLFFGMLILVEIGRRIGMRRSAEDPEGARAGIGAVDAAILALLGFCWHSPSRAPAQDSIGAVI
jgi:hypothetical protein